MADNNKPPSYDNGGQAPPFTTPSQNSHFQAEGIPPQQPYSGPPPNGAPYYPPQQQIGYYPGTATVVGTYPLPPGQPGQQPHVVVVNSPAAVGPAAYVPMTGAIALSCIAFWCFGWLFGGIAFVLAIMAQNAAAVGDKDGAIRLRKASYGVSIAGIVIGIIAIAVIVGVYVSVYNSVVRTTYNPYCYYNSNGIYTCV